MILSCCREQLGRAFCGVGAVSRFHGNKHHAIWTMSIADLVENSGYLADGYS